MRYEEVDIVVVSYHRLDFTEKCLRSIHANTTTKHRVILVDNGSDQKTRYALYSLKNSGLIDVLVLLEKNYGLEPAKNYGLNFVRTPRFIDTDNDIVVPKKIGDKDWLEKLNDLMDENIEYAAISAHPHVFVGDNIDFLLKDGNNIREYSKCGASMRLMRTDLVRKVGGWRTEGDIKTLTRGEEFYICGKLRERGFKVGYSRDVEVFHMFGDEDYGYGKGVEHYHNAIWPPPSDSLYGSYDVWSKET